VKGKAATKSKATTKAKATKASPKSRSSKASSKSKSASTSNGVADSIRSNGVAESIKNGAGEVGPLARKAKVPLLASGAALAGVAGAIVATRSGKRPKVLGISVPKGVSKGVSNVSMPHLNGKKPDAKKISGAVVDAAKRADQFGQGVSRVASSVRNVGETANDAAKKV
jgi:hypothetical protein